MTAKELIALLAAVPLDTEVLVPGYEGGAGTPVFVGMWKFRRNYHKDRKHTYVGDHEPLSEYEDADEIPLFTMDAFYISRHEKGGR